MEHYYVITGNEFGADLSSKRNFQPVDFEFAKLFFNSKKDDDFYCGLYHVNNDGKESVIEMHLNNE